MGRHARALSGAIRLASIVALVITACTTPPLTAPPSASASHPPQALAGVASYALGTLRGDHALVLRARPEHATGSELAELWVVPLDGGVPRLALRYRGVIGIAHDGLGHAVIARQLDPSGTRIAVAATVGDGARGTRDIVVVDLASSEQRVLASAGTRAALLRPAWSREGTRIAYERMGTPSFFTEGIWSVPAAGGEARQLCTSGSRNEGGMGVFFGCAAIVGYTPGGELGFAEVDGYSLVDESGRVERVAGGPRLTSVRAVDHRETRLARAEIALGEQRIVLSGPRGEDARVLVRSNAGFLFEPRLAPAGAQRVLFREARARLGVATGAAVHVLTAAERCPARAEWAPDATRVIYLDACDPALVAVRAIDVDGDGRALRDVALAPLPDAAGWYAVDLAVRRYAP